MFDWQAFQEGAMWFLLAFGAAAVITILFKFLYQAFTPYEERKLIREGNVAAAISLGGALIGFAIALSQALAQATSPVEFLVWAALAALIQILVFVLVRAFLVRDLAARIERGEISTAVYLAAISIAAGLLNAASMTE
jgi:putative membrane protein